MTESERATRQFDELIKTLIALSSPPERQIEICGVGCPGDEMALDFESYYTLCKKLYLEQSLMKPGQFEVLEKLDQYLESCGGQTNADFWLDPNALSSHSDWEEIRSLAHRCLVSLGKSHLDLEISHEIENSSAPGGTSLMIQHTKINLKKAL